MVEPWLSIIGLGEDGPAGLTDASREALAGAEIVFGAHRHLALAGVPGQAWPVPFSVAPLLAQRGRRVAALVSGDPFWHGAGAMLAEALAPGEWRAYPAPGTFSLAAARLGWRLEEVACLGLHAAPFARLRPLLARGARAICLLRDGDAPRGLAVNNGDAIRTRKWVPKPVPLAPAWPSCRPLSSMTCSCVGDSASCRRSAMASAVMANGWFMAVRPREWLPLP